MFVFIPLVVSNILGSEVVGESISVVGSTVFVVSSNMKKESVSLTELIYKRLLWKLDFNWKLSRAIRDLFYNINLNHLLGKPIVGF